MSNDLTTSILREIRDGIHATNARLDETNARLDQTNTQMETGFDRMRRAMVESEMRTATAIVELVGSVREVTVHLRNQNDLRPRMEKCEAEIGELKKKLRSRQG